MAKRIGTLPLHRSYGHGITVRYLKDRRTWAVTQNGKIWALGAYDDMNDVARQLMPYSAKGASRLERRMR